MRNEFFTLKAYMLHYQHRYGKLEKVMPFHVARNVAPK